MSIGLRMLAAAVLLLGSGLATSQTRVPEVPANAQPSRYGGGWDCSRGFQKVRDACEEIVVPDNAYLSSSGARWDCERGYRRVDQHCAAIAIPENAYADDGVQRGWRCDRRFRETEKACVRIVVPVDGYLTDSYGRGWECNRGFSGERRLVRRGKGPAERIPRAHRR